MASFAKAAPTKTSPARKHAAWTNHDTNELPDNTKALYVNTSGTLAMIDVDGTEVAYNVTAGAVLPFIPAIIKVTGSTATVIRWFDT